MQQYASWILLWVGKKLLWFLFLLLLVVDFDIVGWQNADFQSYPIWYVGSKPCK